MILWICKSLVQECMFFEVGSFVLYFQVVFILKILSGQFLFDFFFFWLVAPFLSCKDPSNKKLNWSGLTENVNQEKCNSKQHKNPSPILPHWCLSL